MLALAALALAIGQAGRLLLLSPDGMGRTVDTLTSLCLAALLSVLTLRGGEHPEARSYALGGAFGLMFFTCILGIDRVDPTTVGWLMVGDWAQHYLGWEMYRHEGLNLPPGRITGLWHPVGTSIVFTDSLPLLAMPLSVLSPWLPEQFQYIGAFMALSFVLQGALAARLAQHAGLPPGAQLLVALLFVNAPFLIARLGHDTLTAHWTVLACLLLATALRRHQAVRAWYVIVVLSTLIHPYLAAMCGPMAGAALWWQLRDAPRRVVAHGIAGTVVAAGLLWASGAFIIPSQPSLTSTVPYGHYAANLLTFVTPMNRSVLLPEWPMATSGQYEGYAYLGAGVLLLLLVALVLLRSPRRFDGPGIPGRVWLTAGALALFAISTVLTLGSIRLVDHPLNGGLFGMFRSSGRFVWPLAYALMAGATFAISARLGPQRSAALLLVVAALQVVDLSSTHGDLAVLSRAHRAHTWESPLRDPRWDALASERRHLVFMPPPACGDVPADWIAFQQLAARHALTFNAGFLARHDGAASEAHCHVLAGQMATGTLPHDALYVVNPDWKQRLLTGLPTQTRCRQLDGFETCAVPTNDSAERDDGK